MEAAETAGMRPSERTRIATAASELGRNAVVHGGGGTATVRVVREGGRVGVRLEVVDQGPGIEDVERALGDGFTTGNGLGLGLGGARRLLGHLEIDAAPGSGTRVVGIRWA
jgi:serine/threonine-protein kinase RsbT